MATEIDDWTNDIHTGDAVDTLAELPESSVHMVMTSPPYFGLRDYSVDGQIGLEESLDEYIGELVDVFREVRRVLRPDGSAWLNLGDSYDGGKNKMLVPHRVAIALQEDGWIVRNDVTWAKPNPMPSSVKDRLNTTTEQVFHLVPEPDYWYDLDAIREEHKASTYEWAESASYNTASGATNDENYNHHQSGGLHSPGDVKGTLHPAGKNPGDVFEVTTKPFPDAHFAVYPPELVEKPLKATCPPEVCAECGSPYKHNTLPDPETTPDPSIPWKQSCDCDTDATEAGIALDPFAGAGTTCLVAKRQGRRFVGIDLNEEYVAMAQKRLGLTVDNPEYVREDDVVGLEAFADD